MLEILHVEDDEVFAHFVSSFILKNENITHVDTGKKAIEICSKRSFDLILQDIGLPDINGVTVIELIAKKKPISLVFVTSHPEILSAVEIEQFSREKNILFCGVIDKKSSDAIENIRLCVSVVRALKKMRAASKEQKHKPLSPAEKDILLDLKKKMLPKQIAVKRDASVRTIYTHKNNINQKLGERS